MQTLIINTDGGSRGNPGPAAVGIVIRDEHNSLIKEHSWYLGITTNNIAEYTAVITALQIATEIQADKTCETKIDFFLDSELVVRQLLGIYKIRDPKLQIANP
jgi:ribonuclease HI